MAIRKTKVGMKTGRADGHTHKLLANGVTDPGPKDGHTHRWRKDIPTTTTDAGHSHSIPR